MGENFYEIPLVEIPLSSNLGVLMKNSFKAFIAALFIASIGSASASVVTFNSLAADNADSVGVSYLENGLTFTSSISQPSLYHWGFGNGVINADSSGATLWESFWGERLIVTKTGGGDFFLNSIDLAELMNTGSSKNIDFFYTDGSGSHTKTLTYDGLVGLQTFGLNLLVDSFSLTQQPSPGFQLDNVNFTDINSDPSNNVPEPVSLALFGLGFISLSATRKRFNSK
jgi:hypothetical protein